MFTIKFPSLSFGQWRSHQSFDRITMSCNGCRVLWKGCSESCVLRPCLQWIESPEAQGHATIFIARFFGRAGLMSFISAVPEIQRPALFQSLLLEACEQTINPVNGSVHNSFSLYFLRAGLMSFFTSSAAVVSVYTSSVEDGVHSRLQKGSKECATPPSHLRRSATPHPHAGPGTPLPSTAAPPSMTPTDPSSSQCYTTSPFVSTSPPPSIIAHGP